LKRVGIENMEVGVKTVTMEELIYIIGKFKIIVNRLK
jgi:GTP cyclohydrolase FolE2